DRGQDVPHAVAFGAQVTDVVLVDLNRDGGPAGDGDAVALQSHAFGGVVAHQVDGPHAQVVEDLCAGAEFAGIRGQSEGEVGVDGVGALVLELVGTQFGQQADAAALMSAHVDHNSATGL